MNQVNIVVPSVGESITDGTIAQWLKKDGDAVRADEPVVELETEKATTSVAAPSSGRLVVAVPEGQTVKVGQVIGRVEEGVAAPRPAAAAVKKEAEAPPPAPAGNEAQAPPAAAKSDVPLSPAARQRAADAGIDARQVAGTGRGGRVTKQDVIQFLEKTPPEPSPAPPAPVEANARPQATDGQRETRQRMTSIRQRIA
jgi:2-oxoglutarate dehydrogenase E2 component (dihydrolipoamide succinyltransferase)